MRPRSAATRCSSRSARRPALLAVEAPSEPATSGGAVIAPSSASSGSSASASASASKQTSHDVAMRDYQVLPKDDHRRRRRHVTWTNEDSEPAQRDRRGRLFQHADHRGGRDRVGDDREGRHDPLLLLRCTRTWRDASSTPAASVGRRRGLRRRWRRLGRRQRQLAAAATRSRPAASSHRSRRAGAGTGSGNLHAAPGHLEPADDRVRTSVWLAFAGAWLLAVGVAVRFAVAGRI